MEPPADVSNRRAWQNSLGFVPQAIFLADSSIRENIAFGLPPEVIDDRQRSAMPPPWPIWTNSCDELPDGLETRVGERGVQLSGGQRQRIGIARALYHDADVLVLDEATSALDGITEKLVMDAIHDFSGKKTIIMIAHRLATVKQCDTIYLTADGGARGAQTAAGFDELAERASPSSAWRDTCLTDWSRESSMFQTIHPFLLFGDLATLAIRLCQCL
ncbi:MAG: ATP-binding cassette domain-containing protein [Arhodomonas sp.]|nr:ATP-binding cassette domain-containing protein [Arhodomonas sp.]